MAKDAGRVVPLPKGNWSPDITYEVLDLVSSESAIWMAKKTSQGVMPDEGEYWQLFMNQSGVTVDFMLDTKSTNPIANNVVATNVNRIDATLRSIADIVYPVGSIYMSVNDVYPDLLFGGRWERWGFGRVPVGVAELDSEFNEAEKTGGSKFTETHEHAIADHTHDMSHGHSVPNHTHTMASSGTCTITSSGSHTHNVKYNTIQRGSGNSNVANLAASGTSTAAAIDSSGAHTHTVPNHTHTMNSSGSCTIASTDMTTGAASLATDSFGTGDSGNLQPYITCYMWKRIS